jgi:4'-phosphopantetheinyl transferase
MRYNIGRTKASHYSPWKAMQIQKNDIHIWTIDLNITDEQEHEQFTLLSTDEIDRANRFHFPLHKKYFIAARSMLRTLLSQYLSIEPQDIIFSYTDKHKPYLSENNAKHLQFNLSHSHGLAVYAFTLEHDIGIDIEKIQTDYNPHVAKRFFSEKENQDLLALPLNQQANGFYKIWAYKEAMIKTTGRGIATVLSSFSVSLHQDKQFILLDNKQWSLLSLSIHSEYQAALATNQLIKNIHFWSYFDQSPVLDKTDTGYNQINNNM